jgi:hypothetical protein
MEMRRGRWVVRSPLYLCDLRQSSPTATEGLITREEFMQKISEERATYLKLLNCFSLFSLRGLKLFGEALYFFFELAQFGSARTLFLL